MGTPLINLASSSPRGGFVSEQKEVKCATNAWNLLMIVQEKEIKSSSKIKLVCKNTVYPKACPLSTFHQPVCL